MPLKWTNRSRPPSSGVMKPKPLSSLNHFTVPVAINFPLYSCLRTRSDGPREHLQTREPYQGRRPYAVRLTCHQRSFEQLPRARERVVVRVDLLRKPRLLELLENPPQFGARGNPKGSCQLIAAHRRPRRMCKPRQRLAEQLIGELKVLVD